MTAIMLSCSNETNISQEDSLAGVPMTFNISVDENATTRAAKTAWANGDKIYVFFNGLATKYLVMTYDGSSWSTSSGGGTLESTDFSGLGTKTITAVHFPVAVDVAYADSKFSFTSGGKPVYNYYLYETGKAYTVSGTTVTATLSMGKPSNMVQIHVAGIQGNVSDYTFGCSKIRPVSCKSVGTDGTITEDVLQAGARLSGIADADGGIFAGRLTTTVSADYKFTIASNTLIYTLTRTGKTLTAGKMYNFPALTSTGGSNWAVYNLVNLSATATANCYIVPGGGYYKFLATVRGNGSADLGGISKDIDASSIASAELVWASYGTSTAPAADELIKDISYSDGYVYFSTGDSFREGNALVAIKNSSDQILWSWHIWIHNYNETYLTGANSVKMMDRNLGALSNSVSSPLSYGMYYQWGRKDPFVGLSAATTLAVVQGASRTIQVGKVSIGTSIQNPTNYYVETNVNEHWTNGDHWCSDESNMTLWSPSGKTIFDPCPPGWRMPSFSEITGMGSSDYYTSDKGFPASGYFGTEGSFYNPGNGTIWAATVDGSCAKIQVVAGNHVTYSRSPDMGFNIRCVKEQ